MNKNRVLEAISKQWTVSRKDFSSLAGIAFGYVVLELVGITCPIKWLTGCSCAGCGLSRAWLSVLCLDFSSAVSYHPLFWMLAMIAVIWFSKGLLPNSLRFGLLLAGAASMLAVYFFRLLDSGDVIVVWTPWDGMLFRTARILRQQCRMLMSIV